MRCNATRYRSGGEEPCGSMATVMVAGLRHEPQPRCDQHLLALIGVATSTLMVWRVPLYEALRAAGTDAVDSDTTS